MARRRWDGDLPLDFISWVQTCMSSWISSGATSLRDQASSQRGFAGAAELPSPAPYLAALEADRAPSLDLKTFLKKGMLAVTSQAAVTGRAACAAGGGRGGRQRRGRVSERERQRARESERSYACAARRARRRAVGGGRGVQRADAASIDGSRIDGRRETGVKQGRAPLRKAQASRNNQSQTKIIAHHETRQAEGG